MSSSTLPLALLSPIVVSKLSNSDTFILRVSLTSDNVLIFVLTSLTIEDSLPLSNLSLILPKSLFRKSLSFESSCSTFSFALYAFSDRIAICSVDKSPCDAIYNSLYVCLNSSNRLVNTEISLALSVVFNLAILKSRPSISLPILSRSLKSFLFLSTFILSNDFESNILFISI